MDGRCKRRVCCDKGLGDFTTCAGGEVAKDCMESLQERDLTWLVSLPQGMLRAVEEQGVLPAAGVRYGADPAGHPLGSGGGTAHLLAEAAGAAGCGLAQWLERTCSVVLHGGGQSRRLPAYAAAGKPFLPIPAFRWSTGQRLDQTLFDLQHAFITDFLSQAPPGGCLAIASGDVLLCTDSALPDVPDADVTMVGMRARPEDACQFGVMFCERSDPTQLRYFLQKPSPDEIRQHSRDTVFFLDCGLWLLRERAARLLLQQCGWQEEGDRFAGGHVQPYDLYAEWGPRFGTQPVVRDDALSGLRVAVAVVPDGRFYHFGRNRDVIDSVYELQNPVSDPQGGRQPTRAPHPRQFVQNAEFRQELGRDAQQCLWVENAVVGEHWHLHERHMITNIPDNDWAITLPAGICLDMPPVRGGGRVIRLYGMDDAFRGELGASSTNWMDAPVLAWFTDRGLDLEQEGLGLGTDLQDARLFPVVQAGEDVEALLAWMLRGGKNAPARDGWRRAARLSAADLLEAVDVAALFGERQRRLRGVLPAMAKRYDRNMFLQLDLAHTGRLLQEAGYGRDVVPEPLASDEPMQRVHAHMLASHLAQLGGDASAAEAAEQAAFGVLHDAVLAPVLEDKVHPVCHLLEDQIVWGRSPARLDLAGGWTDTPPYCIEYGGSVLNMAVMLNGQPPVQVFGRLIREPKLVIRSIDLGLSATWETYEDVQQFADLGSGFTVARAAFALAGFAPPFCAERFGSLRKQLEAFGGGIEISMLAAIPKGSGLGTSSILAATLLGVLGDLAGLGWDLSAVSRRVLALEQMLTSGGGWQDQIGGLYGGVKLIETRPGFSQEPVLRWAPPSFFEDPGMRGRLLLYYTGITRVARSILGEIVRGLFLNDRERVDVIRQIGVHAVGLYERILQHDQEGFAVGLARSWTLNQRLDQGTSVPEVEALIRSCGGALSSCKLAGAGGGGYLLLLARDADAAGWIRKQLTGNPPNARARFVEMSVAAEGLQVTRS